MQRRHSDFSLRFFLNLIAIAALKVVESRIPARCVHDGYNNDNDNRITCRNVVLTLTDLMDMRIPAKVTDVRFIDNNITYISAEVLANFVNVTSLEISQNKIRDLPADTFSRFNKLTILKLRKNYLTTIQRNSFSGLQKLEKLDLSYNKMKILPENIFSDLPSVREIKLVHNQIKRVPDGVFSPLTQLKDLFLTKNEISSIGVAAFQNLTMKRIGLSHNRLKVIPPSALRNLKISFKIVLFFNPLSCTCDHLVNFAITLKHLRNKVIGHCASPDNLKDKGVMEAYHVDTTCNACDLQPCQNEGVCQGNKTWYQCRCKQSFIGNNCEQNLCTHEKIQYVERIVYVPKVKTILQYQVSDPENVTVRKETAPAKSIIEKDVEEKLTLLYSMCALEFIVIICLTSLFLWKRYKDMQILREYNNKKRIQILEKIRLTTNRKLQENFRS